MRWSQQAVGWWWFGQCEPAPGARAGGGCSENRGWWADAERRWRLLVQVLLAWFLRPSGSSQPLAGELTPDVVRWGLCAVSGCGEREGMGCWPGVVRSVFAWPSLRFGAC